MTNYKPEPKTAGLHDDTTRNVLWVEDDPDMLVLLRFHADRRRYNMRMDVVSDPDLALRMAERNQYDLCFIDLYLGSGKMKGNELASQIRAIGHEKQPDTYLVSGEHKAELAQLAEAAGIKGVIPKPFNISEELESKLLALQPG